MNFCSVLFLVNMIFSFDFMLALFNEGDLTGEKIAIIFPINFTSNDSALK